MPILALPQSSLSASSTSTPKSKTHQGLDREALDEADDVDDSDLLAIPISRKRVHEADPDAEEGEGEKDDEDEEGPDTGIEMSMGGGRFGVSGMGSKGKGKKKDAGEDIEERGKKRRADTFLLRGQMDEEQAKRFETFSTVAINKNAIKRLNRDMFDQHCSPQLSQVVAGMAKIFIADVIELAKDLQPHSAHPKGPLQPYHLKLARMCLEEKGMIRDPVQGAANGLRAGKPLFRRR